MVTPSLFAEIVQKLGERKNRLVTIYQAAFPQMHQSDAMRKILLDELGRDGFEKDLEQILKQHEACKNGTGRNILAGKGVPK
jgi:hypothetical protein